MAALSDYYSPVLVDLNQLKAEDLDLLLGDEIDAWQRLLDWDFRPSADLVRRFVRMRQIGGFGLTAGRVPIGYCYYVCEEGKGLLGDVYVLPEFRTPDLELRLISAGLSAIWSTPGMHRVESQLMMILPETKARMPDASRLERFRRDFMMAGFQSMRIPPRRDAGVSYVQWSDRDREQAARLIARCYEGHVDARINDQYRSISGARRFLNNIVQYPGCGSFFQPGSLLAVDPVDSRIAGLLLASLIAFDVGHITQVCVDPEWQGRGIASELLRRSVEAMRAQGCRRVSLTVTAANRQACELYEKCGLKKIHEFDAFVWESHGV
jgi:ribosomal protein S18 acetylase RimI-like enzyme